MISRRKFLRAGALLLPASAFGQVYVPNRQKFQDPSTGQGINWIAADFMNGSTARGIGWASDVVWATVAGTGFPSHVAALAQVVPCMASSPAGEIRWKRKLQIGNNWTQIRIGWLMDVAATSGPTVYNTVFGMCNSAVANPAAAGGNLVSVQQGGGGAWTFSAGANAYILPGISSDSYALTIINGSAATSTYGAASAVNHMTSATGHRNLQFAEFTKGSPNYTVRSYAVRNAGDAIQDMTIADLNTGLGLASGSDMVISGRTLVHKSTTIAMSETGGNLDSVTAIGVITSTFTHYNLAVAVRKIA